MSSSNAARVQGAGPSCTDGDPIQVCPYPGSVFPPGPIVVSDIQDGAGVSIMDAALNAAQVSPVGADTVNGYVSIPFNAGTAAKMLELGYGFNYRTGNWQAISVQSNIAEDFDLFNPLLGTFCVLAGKRAGDAQFHVPAVGNQSDGAAVQRSLYTFSSPALYTNSPANAGQPSFDMERTPGIFQSVQATAAGNTALWTPTAGTKFRLMRYLVTVTGDAEAAALGAVTVSLFDGAAGAIGQDHDFFVPATGTSLQVFGSQYTSGWVDLGNGILSAAANNVLNVNLSAALTAGNVRVICCGTEE